MATPIERAQEIANRGIQDRLPPDKKARFDELVNRGVITIPGVPGGQEMDVGTDEYRKLQIFAGIDPDFSQEGVKNTDLRANLSRMDTPEEREKFLGQVVGSSGFTKDRFGNLALTPEGAAKMGQETDMPVIIDEPSLTMGDIADLRGVAPTILGGMAGGAAATGLGIPAGMALAGLVAAGAKGADEAIDALRGQNIQGPAQVGIDIAREGALAAGGEGLYRGILAPLGRKILSPNAKQALPGSGELLEEAQKIGVRPKVANLVNRPILTRISGMVDTVFGDINAVRNSKALNTRLNTLRNSFNRKIDNSIDIGSMIKSDIRFARKEFGEAARAKYALVDEFTKGSPIVPTGNIKAQAQEIIDVFPKSIEGKPVLTSPERIKDLNDILSLPDNITVEQLQALRSTLSERIELGTPVPGVSSREARLIIKSANQSIDDTIDTLSKSITPNDVASKQGLEALKEADRFYAEGIKKFDNATVKRILKDPSIAGSLDPERVVDLLFKKGSVTPIKRVFSILPKSTQDEVRGEAITKILENATTPSKRALIDDIFDGNKLLKSLNSYGKPTLEAALGKDRTNELYNFAKVMQSASKPEGSSGGLVAASIAVRPLQNISKLVKLRILGRILNSENGLKWLIKGVEAPKTREGSAALARFSAQLMQASEGLTLGKKMKGNEEMTFNPETGEFQ